MAIKKTITVNGQSYNSVEELPPELRTQYERAMQAMQATQGGDVNARITSEITFNGKEVASFNVLPMPARVLVSVLRWFVKRQIDSAAPQTRGNLPASTAGPRRTGTARSLIIWLLMAAMMFAWYFLYKAGR